MASKVELLIIWVRTPETVRTKICGRRITQSLGWCLSITATPTLLALTRPRPAHNAHPGVPSRQHLHAVTHTRDFGVPNIPHASGSAGTTRSRRMRGAPIREPHEHGQRGIRARPMLA